MFAAGRILNSFYSFQETEICSPSAMNHKAEIKQRDNQWLRAYTSIHCSPFKNDFCIEVLKEKCVQNVWKWASRTEDGFCWEERSAVKDCFNTNTARREKNTLVRLQMRTFDTRRFSAEWVSHSRRRFSNLPTGTSHLKDGVCARGRPPAAKWKANARE